MCSTAIYQSRPLVFALRAAQRRSGGTQNAGKVGRYGYGNNMLRLFVSASIFVIVLGLAGLPAMAQTISPTQQEEQRAAKSVACRKQAKEQKLSGSERRAFLKDCIRKDDGAEAAKLSDAEKVALEKAMASCKEEAKGMKFKWHWRKRQKYVKNCSLGRLANRA